MMFLILLWTGYCLDRMTTSFGEEGFKEFIGVYFLYECMITFAMKPLQHVMVFEFTM